jgi:hypothetical protein
LQLADEQLALHAVMHDAIDNTHDDILAAILTV